MVVPIVTIGQAEDKRKAQKTGWQEARLSLAYAKGSISPIYRATLGSTDDAGNQLAEVVDAAGRNESTCIHIVSDGAPWIAEQVERVIGSSAYYLIDFII